MIICANTTGNSNVVEQVIVIPKDLNTILVLNSKGWLLVVVSKHCGTANIYIGRNIADLSTHLCANANIVIGQCSAKCISGNCNIILGCCTGGQ